MEQWLRVNLNGQAFSRLANIVSNTVLLASNAYLLASNIKGNITDRKRSRTIENLQLTAEVASAVAGLTKVVTDNIDKYHADREDL